MAARVNGSSAIVVKSERHLDTFRAGHADYGFRSRGKPANEANVAHIDLVRQRIAKRLARRRDDQDALKDTAPRLRSGGHSVKVRQLAALPGPAVRSRLTLVRLERRVLG